MSFASKNQYSKKNKMPGTDESLSLKIPDHVCFYIEQELSAYRVYKLALSQLELDLEDIINLYGQVLTDRLPSNLAPGDPVSLSALRALIIEEKIKYYTSRIRRIESGIDLLNRDEKEVLTRKYFSENRYSNEDIIGELHINRSYFYKVRQDIIYKFALIFGLL